MVAVFISIYRKGISEENLKLDLPGYEIFFLSHHVAGDSSGVSFFKYHFPVQVLNELGLVLGGSIGITNESYS